MKADQALQTLLAGNERFRANAMQHSHQDEARRVAISQGQHPIAAVLTCSDSRVAPEIIFDQGLGDIFVVRNAGNIIDDVVLGSIEYAVEHLHTPLVLVVGHTQCGAVKAAVEGHELPGHLSSLTNPIKPAIEQAKTQAGDIVDNAVRANVAHVVDQLKNSQPILKELAEKNEIKIVGAVYNLDTGAVNIQTLF